jgi:hypothetical protein
MEKEEEKTIRIWEITVSEVPRANGQARITTRYGVHDGNITERVTHVKKGKNIVRTNETTRLQALSSAMKKFDVNYVLTDPSQVVDEPGFENNGKQLSHAGPGLQAEPYLPTRNIPCSAQAGRISMCCQIA